MRAYFFEERVYRDAMLMHPTFLGWSRSLAGGGATEAAAPS